MEYLNSEQIKIELINILDDIHNFCHKNGLHYYLAYGTLLGAIRHHGFIPWDDDIDIYMPRPDYDKMIKYYKSDKYAIHAMENDIKWPLNYAKVCDSRYCAIDEFGHDYGLFVDIFPLDGAPENDKEFHRHVKQIRNLQKLWSNQLFSPDIKISKNNQPVKNMKVIVGKFLHSIIPFKSIVSSLIFQMSKYDFNSSKFCCSYSDTNIRIDKNCFVDGCAAEFEGRNLSIPNSWDQILRMHYGDYMELPPEDKRHLTHGLKVYKK